MLIRIQHRDGRYDYIKHTRLDDLILTGQIARFLRSSGWTQLGSNTVRRRDRGEASYHGPERRQAA